MEVNIKFLDLMEQRCSNCDGTGQVPSHSFIKKKKIKHNMTCIECGGRGKQLTEFGQAIVKLVKEWSTWDNDIDDILSRLDSF
jgi:hypothetical protein